MTTFPRSTRAVTVALALLLIAQPFAAWSAPGTATGRPSRYVLTEEDVVLGPRGEFHGAVFDRSGSRLAGTTVALFHRTRQVAETRTDARGSFSIGDLPCGVYVLTVAGSQRTYRLWNVGTEPPTATTMALIVAEDSSAPWPSPMSRQLVARSTPEMRSLPAVRRPDATPPRPVVRGQSEVVRQPMIVRGMCHSCYQGPNGRPVSYSLYDLFEQHPALGYTFVAAAITVPIVVVAENQSSRR